MNDIARLDIQVSTAGPKAAVTELDRLNAAAGRTVAAAGKLGNQWGTLSAQVQTGAASAGSAARELDRLDKQAAKTTATTASMGAQAVAAGQQVQRGAEAASSGMRKISAATDAATRQLGLNRAGIINLSYQLNDIATSLASGASPFMVMAQQGGQVFQIMQGANGGVGAGLRHVGSMIVNLLTPLRLLSAGVAAVGIVGVSAFSNWDNAITNAQRSLNGIGALSGLTAQQLTRVAQQGAQQGNISAGQGLSAAGGFAQAGMSGGNIQALVAGVGAYTRAFGGDVSDNAEMLAKVFGDVEKAADFVQRRFLVMEAQTKENILSLYRSGQTEQARNILTAEFTRGLASTTQALSVLESVTQTVRNGFSQFWMNVSRGVDKLVRGSPASSAANMNRLRTDRDDLVDHFNKYGDQLAPEQRAALLAELNRINQEMIDLQKGAAKKTLDIEKEKQDKLRIELQGRAQDLIKTLTPEFEGLKALAEQLKLLLASGIDTEPARLALERLRTAFATFQTPLQQIVLDSQLATRATLARSLTERVGIEAQQAYISTLRQTKDELQAVAAAEAARNRILAVAARDAANVNRNARNQSELIGLNETQRAFKEIEQRMRDLRERLTSNQSLAVDPIVAPFRVGLDNATAQLKAFTEALSSATSAASGSGAPGRRADSGRPADSEWMAKFTNRAGPLGASWTGGLQQPVPIQPSGRDRSLINDMLGFPLEVGRGASRPGSLPPTGQGSASDLSITRERTNALNQEAEALRRRTLAELDSAQAIQKSDVAKRALADIERQSTASQVNSQAQIEIMRSAYLMGGEAAAIYAEKVRLIAAATINGTIELPGVRQKIDEVSAAMGRGVHASAAFTESLRRIDEVKGMTGEAFNTFFSGMARGESAAKALQSAVSGLTQSLIRMATNLLMSGLFGGGSGGGGLLSGIFKMMMGGGGGATGGPLILSALGNVFTNGKLTKFANGGVVNSPTMFPLGAGLMGEAGPEAIMPLKRDPSGKLGVATSGRMGGDVNVQVINQTPAQVSQRSRRNADGSRMIEFLISAVGEAQADGRMDGPMQRFGVSPKVTQR